MKKKKSQKELKELVLHKFGMEISLASAVKKNLKGRRASFNKNSSLNPEPKYGVDRSIDFSDISDKLISDSDENTFTDFPGFTKRFRNKHDKFPAPGDYARKIKSFNNLYCNKCKINKYCPYFIQDRVCFFFSSGFGLPRIPSQYGYHLMVYINYYLWYSSIFTNVQTSFDMQYFMFLCYLFVRVEKDKEAADHSPKLRETAKGRKTTALDRLYTASSSVQYYYSKEVAEIERRWKNLGFPIDKAHKYYPKT
jgi:hypothetical protein